MELTSTINMIMKIITFTWVFLFYSSFLRLAKIQPESIACAQA